jgi:hypothetical protein
VTLLCSAGGPGSRHRVVWGRDVADCGAHVSSFTLQQYEDKAKEDKDRYEKEKAAYEVRRGSVFLQVLADLTPFCEVQEGR